jgi:uncharacterized surface protein with fasciclin (FAS1) repeats
MFPSTVILSAILASFSVCLTLKFSIHPGTKWSSSPSTALNGIGKYDSDPRLTRAQDNLILKMDTANAYAGPAWGGKKDKNVLGVLADLGNFNVLLTAIKAAGLEQKMATKRTTLIAPTDEAFSHLPAGNVDALLNNPRDLENLLLFHVHPGKFNCTRNARTFNTALKGTGPRGDLPKQLAVKVASWTEETWIITGQPNHAKVTTRAIECTNGLIHVVDEVLIPYEGDTPPQVTFIGARDIKGEETLQRGYYGNIAGTDRHGGTYTGPVRKYEPVAVGNTWHEAAWYNQDAPANSPGMSSLEDYEW